MSSSGSLHDNIFWLLHILAHHAENSGHFIIVDGVGPPEDAGNIEDAEVGPCRTGDLNFEHLDGKILLVAAPARIDAHVLGCHLPRPHVSHQPPCSEESSGSGTYLLHDIRELLGGERLLHMDIFSTILVQRIIKMIDFDVRRNNGDFDLVRRTRSCAA